MMFVASVTASLPRTKSRAANGESSATSYENFTFHGQPVWEMCRYTSVEIALSTRRLTLAHKGCIEPVLHVMTAQPEAGGTKSA